MLVLVRGLPGSGKSTVARHLAAALGYTHFESDMFFETSGTYQFEASKIGHAHAWCQKITRETLGTGRRVIVSNTFTQKWEIEPYLRIAKFVGVPVQVIEVHGNFGSIHNVPESTIQKMRDRWEPFTLS